MIPQSLLAATLANPDVLWAVLTADVKVAGPWERGADTSSREGVDSVDVWTVVNVEPVIRCKNAHAPESPGDAYCATCGKRVNVRMFVASAAWQREVFRTRAEAESWCDAQLRAQGWMLAEGEVERG